MWAGREGSSKTGTTVGRQSIYSFGMSLTGNLHQKSSTPNCLCTHTHTHTNFDGMEKSHRKCLLKQHHFEEELRICISASPKDEKAPIAVCGTSPDGPKLMRKSMGYQAKDLRFLIISSRNWMPSARQEPFMVPMQPLLFGKPKWWIRLDLLLKCADTDELGLFAQPALSFLKTTEFETCQLHLMSGCKMNQNKSKL